MGHRKVKSDKNIKISALTVSQFERIETLKLTADYINKQTSNYIIEWVIVNGSKNEKEAELFKLFVNNELKKLSKIEIKYIEYNPNVKLGGFRNLANDNALGDILIWFDDDDYYYDNYVKYTTKRLIKSNKLIAGSPIIYFYDFNMDKMFMSDTVKNHGENSVSNSCLAYKREYLDNHRYNDEDEKMEEYSFTNSFKEEIVRLNAEHTTILSSHNNNTFNKKEFIYHGLIFSGNVVETDKKYPDEEKYKIYKSLFVQKKVNDYDIVYLCCPYSAPWHPTDKNLGGSEQAVIELSKELAKNNRICVYMDIKEDITIDGVDYKDWRHFRFEDEYNRVIAWRPVGMIFLKYFNIDAKEVVLDLHDAYNEIFIKYFDDKKYDKYYFKSEFHRNQYKEIIKNDNKCVIVPNGVRKELFENYNSDEVIIRNPYRFCYTSCYSRGLEQIVPYIWHRIHEKEPRAELHCYYGMKFITDERLRTKLTFMLAQPGVMDHGKQSKEMIAREKHLSTFHLYITETDTETDCIAIKESVSAGCIPLLSNSKVFKERDGVHYDIEDIDEEKIDFIVNDILDLIKNEERRNNLIDKFKNNNSIKNWEQISKLWFL